MSEELKPCPFCASYPVRSDADMRPDEAGNCCYCCGANVDIQTWQTRPIEDALRAEVQYWKDQHDNLFTEMAECSITEDALRAEIDALREANRWIPVDERLPEMIYGVCSDDVRISYRDAYNVCPAHWQEDGRWWGDSWQFSRSRNGKVELSDFDFEVTHWRPLPAAPDLEVTP